MRLQARKADPNYWPWRVGLPMPNWACGGSKARKWLSKHHLSRASERIYRGIYGASCNVFEAGALDRYERRARSRRKFAIRDYVAARAALPPRQRPIEDQPSEEIAIAEQHEKYVLSSFWPNEPNLASASDTAA